MSYSSERIGWMTALALVFALFNTSPVLADDVAAHVSSVRSDLTISAAADRVASSSAATIASAGALFHADLSSLLGPCDSAGEIVGFGPNVASVFTAFRNSPPHWSILTNPAWTAMGTGLASGSNGSVWVSVVFCAESANASSSPPAPTPPAPGRNEGSPNVTRTPQVELEPARSVKILAPLPAIGARRALIRALLDEHAQAMLPEWYTGLCGKDDRGRMLEDLEKDNGACPLAY